MTKGFEISVDSQSMPVGEFGALATHVAIGWTAVSVLTAIVWSIYRAPGRSQRLLLEDGELVGAQRLSRADLYAHVELFSE